MGTAPMPEVVNGYKWELYNLNEDYSQAIDLAQSNPDKLHQLQELFLLEAAKYNVFPLDNSILERLITPRPSATAGRKLFTYSGVVSGVPGGNAPNILNKSYTITAEIEIPANGADGMLATTGGRFGGFGLYILKQKPVFLYNFVDIERFRWEGPDTLPPVSIPSSSTSHRTATTWAAAVRASSRWMARKSPTRKFRTLSQLLCHGTRPSMSVLILAPVSTTRTTRCRSPLPGRSTS